jgi:hypothetical protein
MPTEQIAAFHRPDDLEAAWRLLQEGGDTCVCSVAGPTSSSGARRR